MTHLSDDDLVLHYYGEAGDLRTAAMHLQACEECRRRFEELSQALVAMQACEVPERGEDYGAHVWQTIRRRLEAEPDARGWWRTWRMPVITFPRLAVAGSVVALVVAAFVAGRSWPARDVPAAAPRASEQASAPAVRERILLVAVGDHLDRSQMVLAEITNLPPSGRVDISEQQDWARDLVASNRLYRQAAARDGKAGVADVLDELERVLVDVANGPSTVSAADLDRLRERIESEGLAFKVKVLGSQVRRDADRPMAGAAGSKS
jgi:hypothetical protein